MRSAAAAAGPLERFVMRPMILRSTQVQNARSPRNEGRCRFSRLANVVGHGFELPHPAPDLAERQQPSRDQGP